MTSTRSTAHHGATVPPAADAPSPAGDDARRRSAALRAISRRSFASLATVSTAGRPHVAGVLYAAVTSRPGAPFVLYVSTDLDSRKGRNIAARPQVAVTIPVRRLPVGPPSSIQFQGTAALLAADDDEIAGLVAGGELGAVTGHGELERPGAGFVRIVPGTALATYGIGMSLISLLRHPLDAAGRVDLGTGTATPR